MKIPIQTFSWCGDTTNWSIQQGSFVKPQNSCSPTQEDLSKQLCKIVNDQQKKMDIQIPFIEKGLNPKGGGLERKGDMLSFTDASRPN